MSVKVKDGPSKVSEAVNGAVQSQPTNLSQPPPTQQFQLPIPLPLPHFASDKDEAWHCICLAHAIRCFATRSWKFFLPLYLSRSCGSLRATAAMALAKNLAVVTLSTTAANLFHSTNNSFFKATILENLAVVSGGILLYIFAYSSDEATCEAPFSSILFGIAIACACIDAVSTSLLTTVISKEWVAVLYPNSHMLASANARLSQIDLLAATLSPIVVSLIVERGGYPTVLFLLVSQHAVGAFLILRNIERAMQLKPHLAVIASSSSSATMEKGAIKKTILVNPFCIFLDDVVPLRAKMVTASFVLLYFTVLSAGAVMTAWLNSTHTAERTIAGFGSACNLVGALATILAPPLIRRFGNFRAGVVAQFGQCACCVLATTAFHQYRLTGNDNTYMPAFLLSVVASRTGIYVFDLAERQMLQESVPRARQTVFFNTERGLRELALFGMMYLSYLHSKPESFYILVNLSAAAAMLSSVILTVAMFL